MISLVLILGLAVFYSIEAVRRLPLIDVLTARGVKPFACHVCMSLWTSAAWCIALYALGRRPDFVILGPAVAGVALTLLYVTDAVTRPPSLP